MSSILELKQADINSSITNRPPAYESIVSNSSQNYQKRRNKATHFDTDHNSQKKYELQRRKINKMVSDSLQEVYSSESLSRLQTMKKIQNAIYNLETQKQFLKDSFLREDKLNNLKQRFKQYQTEKMTIQQNIAIWLEIVNNPQQNSYPKLELDNLSNLYYCLEQQYNFEGEQNFSNFFILENIKSSIQTLKLKQQQCYIIECQACELLNEAYTEPIQCKKLQKLMLANEKYRICYQFDPFSNAAINYNQINLMINELMEKKTYLENEIRRGRENLRNPLDKPVSLQVLKDYKQFFGDFH